MFGQGQGQVCHIDGPRPVMERDFKEKTKNDTSHFNMDKENVVN